MAHKETQKAVPGQSRPLRNDLTIEEARQKGEERNDIVFDEDIDLPSGMKLGDAIHDRLLKAVVDEKGDVQYQRFDKVTPPTTREREAELGYEPGRGVRLGVVTGSPVESTEAPGEEANGAQPATMEAEIERLKAENVRLKAEKAASPTWVQQASPVGPMLAVPDEDDEDDEDDSPTDKKINVLEKLKEFLTDDDISPFMKDAFERWWMKGKDEIDVAAEEAMTASEEALLDAIEIVSKQEAIKQASQLEESARRAFEEGIIRPLEDMAQSVRGSPYKLAQWLTVIKATRATEPEYLQGFFNDYADQLLGLSGDMSYKLKKLELDITAAADYTRRVYTYLSGIAAGLPLDDADVDIVLKRASGAYKDLMDSRAAESVRQERSAIEFKAFVKENLLRPLGAIRATPEAQEMAEAIHDLINGSLDNMAQRYMEEGYGVTSISDYANQHVGLVLQKGFLGDPMQKYLVGETPFEMVNSVMEQVSETAERLRTGPRLTDEQLLAIIGAGVPTLGVLTGERQLRDLLGRAEEARDRLSAAEIAAGGRRLMPAMEEPVLDTPAVAAQREEVRRRQDLEHQGAPEIAALADAQAELERLERLEGEVTPVPGEIERERPAVEGKVAPTETPELQAAREEVAKFKSILDIPPDIMQKILRGEPLFGEEARKYRGVSEVYKARRRFEEASGVKTPEPWTPIGGTGVTPEELHKQAVAAMDFMNPEQRLREEVRLAKKKQEEAAFQEESRKAIAGIRPQVEREQEEAEEKRERELKAAKPFTRPARLTF